MKRGFAPRSVSTASRRSPNTALLGVRRLVEGRKKHLLADILLASLQVEVVKACGMMHRLMSNSSVPNSTSVHENRFRPKLSRV